MTNLKPKQIQLQAYDIVNDDPKASCSDLFSILQKRLNHDESANKRRMKLSSSSSEEDVLTDFSISEHGIFCVIMRISPTDDIPTIPDSLFDGNIVQLTPQNDNEKKTVTVLQTIYVYVGKNHINSTLPHSQIKRLQVYFNFLLSYDGIDRTYKFEPSIKVPEGIQLNEMKEFIIGDQAHLPPVSNEKNTKENGEQGMRIINVAADFLKNLTSVVPDVDELIKNGILSARLLISFTKPRKMTESDYKRFLSSHIKAITDAEDVKIKLKNEKTLKGKDILRNKSVDIERLDRHRLNERDLLYEMKEFLKELES